jgi:hypothetical protein
MFECAETDWDGGACIDVGMACTTDDGTDGIYACDTTTCVADTIGDDTCDSALDCWATGWDDEDCEAPEPGPGVACDATDWSGEIVEGVYDCDMECTTYTTWIGDSMCDSRFECADTDWDGGDCDIGPGYACTDDVGGEGIADCDGGCIADTLGDTTCDAAFECAETDWDGGDCTPPTPGGDCTYDSYGYEYDGVVDCTGTCGSDYSLGSGYACDADFDCEELGWDLGDCIAPGDACTTDGGDDGIFACDDMTCVIDTMGDGTCDDALDCGDLSYDGDDCEVSACYETDLGSALGTALATGSSVDFTSSSIEGSCFTGSAASEGIWGWTAPTAGTFCFDIRGSDYDTSLAIFDEGCGVEIACDEDSGPGYTSYTSADLTEGQIVSIVIDSWGTSDTGTYSLAITEGACE